MLPPRGRPVEEVLGDLDALAAGDGDFRAGRLFSLVYHADEALEEVAAAAHERFLWHNALNPGVFPSLRRMQADVVATAASLLGGAECGDEPAGFMTSGGTESILMAVKAAKVRAARERGVERPNVVMATSAHAAFDKACDYFGLEPRRVDVRPDFRADVDGLADACDDSTALLVGSAPQYPQGVIDPIADIAALAAARGASCHVDACMGGFVLPFLGRLGLVDAAWDLRVPGVTSISADVHKYGYVPKGASVVVYRSRALRRDQTFTFDGWLGGSYGSSGVLGTKPGGPIAAAWAAIEFLGEEGFLRLSEAAFRARERLVEGVRSIPGLAVVGEPEVTLAAITAADVDVDVFAVGDELWRRGWHLDRQTPPDSLHATVTAGHAAGTVLDDLLADLRASVDVARGARADDRSTDYAVTE